MDLKKRGIFKSFYILGGTILKEYAFVCFILAASLQSFMFSLFSGTFTAFFHDILEEKGKLKNFTKTLSKMRANVSFISIFFILFLPFFTEISLFFPFVIALIVDIIGLWAIVTTPNTKVKEQAESSEEKHKTISQVFSEARKLRFIPVALFGAFIGGVSMGQTAFQSVYLVDIGLPLIWVGAVMALSRFFWFVFGHFVHVLEKYVSMKQLFFAEIFIFSGMYFIVSLFPNLYVVGLTFALVFGYKWGRSSLISKYILEKYSPDKRYKATILSINSQFSAILSIIISLGIGYAMNMSFQLGYLILGFVSIIGLSISYYFIFRRKNENRIKF